MAALVELAKVTGGDQTLLACVGAGPLEGLVSHSGHGDATLADVDRAARQEPLFRRALENVWLGSNVSDVVKNRLSVLGATVLGGSAKD